MGLKPRIFDFETIRIVIAYTLVPHPRPAAPLSLKRSPVSMPATKQRPGFTPGRRIIVASCFGIQAIGVGIYVSSGVFFNPLMETFGWSRAVIAGASSLAFFIMGIFGILVGRFNDRFGPRLIMTATAAFFGLGYMLTAAVHSIWQFYLFYGVVFGIGLSAIDVIALTTVARWFRRRRGLMTGIAKVGTGAGQFVVPLLITALISRYGWRLAYLMVGGGAMVLLAGIAQLLRRDPGTASDPAEQHAPPVPLARVLRSVQLWTTCLLNLVVVFCLLIVMVHIVPHVRDTGATAAAAAGVLAAIGGVSMIGRFITGLFIDRIGSRRSMLVSFGLLIASLLWLLVAGELWTFYLFAAVYGLAHGGFFTAISPLVAEWFGVDHHGTLFGLLVFFGATGGAMGPVAAGALFDLTGSYRAAFLMIIALSVVGLGLILSLKPLPPGNTRCRAGVIGRLAR
jgi:MFS family permease